MNSTPAEFRRTLAQAFGEAATDDASGVLLSVEGVQIHFALHSEAPRQIGALQLAVLRVEIERGQGAAGEVGNRLARVDRATQGGGG